VTVRLYGRESAQQNVKTDGQGRFEFGDVVERDKLDLSVRRGDQWGESTSVAAGTVEVVLTAPPPTPPKPAPKTP
jgi:hypothetical protein